MNSVCFLSENLRSLISSIERGERTAEDLARQTASRTKLLQDRFFPWANFSEDILLEQARVSAKKRAAGGAVRRLEGIPVAVKDTFNTADFPTEMGSALWKGFTPGNDARMVYEIQRAGGLVAGKTVTAEFAVHALNETLNPHDTSRTPGTSSSGSAVAISLGIVPVALGSQTAGSIVRPASFCGVYGFKPSFGTIARTGTLKTTDSLDTLGFFTASPEDLRLVFDEVRVRGKNYPYVHRYLDLGERDKTEGYQSARPRVAWTRTHTWEHAPAYARDALQSWVHKCAESGCPVEEVTLPEGFAEAHEIHRNIYNFSLAYYFKQEANDLEQISLAMRELIEDGRTISSSVYQEALGAQEELCRQMDGLASDYDVIVSLSTAGSAPPREVPEQPDPALLWTLLHLPAVSAPVFRCPNGFPFGLQIVSRRFNDYRLTGFIERMTEAGLLPAGPAQILEQANAKTAAAC